jgi:hypothetical protein
MDFRQGEDGESVILKALIICLLGIFYLAMVSVDGND